jgi:hypothetical protein
VRLTLKKLFLCTIIFFFVSILTSIANARNAKPFIHYIKSVSAICTRVVDGDTIIVNIAGQKELIPREAMQEIRILLNIILISAKGG